MGNEDTWFKGSGQGIPHGEQPITVKFPPHIAAILRSLPNRSKQVREWVIQGMIRDGLLPEGDRP